jgi:ribosomal protein L37AE/L43A
MSRWHLVVLECLREGICPKHNKSLVERRTSKTDWYCPACEAESDKWALLDGSVEPRLYEENP